MMKYYVGTYATSPVLFNWDPILATKYMDEIKCVDLIKGLEHPFWGNSLHKFDDDWFLNNIDKNWDFIFTCIPGTMMEMSKNPHFGLASDDDEGRLAAVDFIYQANKAVNKLNNFLGRKAVQVITLHSAPNRSVENVTSSKKSFLKSLQEISKLNWYDVKLMVEHCDAWNGKHTPEKGFLNLEDEIEVLEELNMSEEFNAIGVFLNWGRSVIEGRNTDTILQHIRLAKQNNLLKGLFFSGCSDKESPWGIWKDTHMPPLKTGSNRYFADESLMSRDKIKETLMESEADKLDYLGIKLLDALPDSSVKRRVGINQETLKLIDHIICINLLK